MRLKLEIAAGIIVLLVLVAGAVTYVQEREARLRADITSKLLQQNIDTRDKARDSQIAQLQSQLNSVKTPAQATKQLPTVINLPQPVKQVTAEDIEKLISAHLQKDKLPDAPSVIKAGDLVVPESDIKPLYARLNECKQNAIDLKACQEDYKDMTKQRNDYRTALKGGTFMQRVKRNGKWMAVGGGVAVVTLCLTGRCKL